MTAPPASAASRPPVTVTIRLALRSDADHAMSVLARAAAAAAAQDGALAPRVLLAEIEPSALLFEVSVAVPEQRPAEEQASDLRLALLRAVRRHGLELAHPQHDIHLRDLDVFKAAFTMASAGRRDTAAAAADAPAETRDQ